MTLVKLTQGTQIAATAINNIFSKLDEIRRKHSVTQTFSTTVATQGAKATNAFQTNLKADIKLIEDGSFFIHNNNFSNQITIPSVGTLIKALEHYNNYVDVINNLDGVCINYSSNFTSDFTSNFTNRSNFGDNSVNSNNSNDGNFGNFGSNYCQACTYDFPGCM